MSALRVNRIGMLAGALALWLGSCTSQSFGHRSAECDPDDRLGELLHHYDDCKRGDCGEHRGHVLVDCDRAWNELERHAMNFPRHVPTQMANAVLAYEERDPVKAERYLGAVFALQSVHPEAAILKSRISIEAGNLPAAKRLLTAQVNCTPDHFGLREALSAIHYMSGDLQAAGAELDVAEGLGAPAWRVAFNRGLIAEKQDDMRAAEEQYAAAVAGNPDFKPAQSRLAGVRASGRAAAPPEEEGGQ